jgi:hypothetical protein
MILKVEQPMLRLYCQSRSSSQEIQLVRPMPVPQWEALKRRVIRYMEDTYQPPGSIEVLKKIPLQLWEGTNSFSDEFELLFLKADMATYIELEREDDTGNFQLRRVSPTSLMPSGNSAIRYGSLLSTWIPKRASQLSQYPV